MYYLRGLFFIAYTIFNPYGLLQAHQLSIVFHH